MSPDTTPAILLIDAGNTRTKWALAAARTTLPIRNIAGQWLAHGNASKQNLDTLAADWQLAIDSLASQTVMTGVLVSNVAGPVVEATLRQQLGAVASLAGVGITFFQSQAQQDGVTNGYQNPGQLGCDRFASLIGAHHRFPGTALLVVTAGTATTIDALDAQGVFHGGLILPGLGTMMRSLSSDTAQLAALLASSEQGPDNPLSIAFATRTSEGMMNGCMMAHIGAILHAHHQWEKTCSAPVICVLSGGGAPYLAPELPLVTDHIDHLVLLGLHTSMLLKPC